VIRFRTHHRRALRGLALLLLVIGWGVPLAFPHLADDDLLCAVVETGDGRDHARVDGSDSSRDADHCAVCHSLRSLRNAGLIEGDTSIVGFSARTLAPATGARPIGGTPLRLPARAPPA
jgi:hypothetical protein